jgi:hypothetical protein
LWGFHHKYKSELKTSVAYKSNRDDTTLHSLICWSKTKAWIVHEFVLVASRYCKCLYSQLIIGEHVQRLHVCFRQESTRVNQDANYDEWWGPDVSTSLTLLVAFCRVLHGKSQATHLKKQRIRQRTRREWMTSRRSGESSTLLEVIIITDQIMDIFNMRILWGSQFLTTASLPLDAFAIYSHRRFPIHNNRNPPNERKPVTRNPINSCSELIWIIWHLRGWIVWRNLITLLLLHERAIGYGQSEMGSLCGTLSELCSEVMCFTIVVGLIFWPSHVWKGQFLKSNVFHPAIGSQ